QGADPCRFSARLFGVRIFALFALSRQKNFALSRPFAFSQFPSDPLGIAARRRQRERTSMLTKEEAAARREYAHALFRKAGIFVTDAEKERIETADFGLNDFERTGLGVLVYVNTERCCAKELAMWPRQTCPEHRHPPVGSDPGKEETFRCRWGTVYLYVAGKPASTPACRPPAGRESA